MRRRKVIAMLAGIILVLSISAGGAEKKRNGYWWESYPYIYKLGLIEGYTSASHHAAGLIDEHLVSLYDFSGITFGQYLEGIDAFYKDYKNKQILFRYAILWVRDDIKGDSPRKMKEWLDTLRKNSVKAEK